MRLKRNSESVAALPQVHMGTLSVDGPYCCKSISIESRGNSVVATVVDKSRGYEDYSIDLSTDAFRTTDFDL